MRFASLALIALAATLPSLASASCFSIYNRQDKLVYQSTVNPVNLALPLTQALRPRYPNTLMVMDPNESSCTEVGAGSSSARGEGVDKSQSMSTAPLGPLGLSPVTRNSRAPVSTAVNAPGKPAASALQ